MYLAGHHTWRLAAQRKPTNSSIPKVARVDVEAVSVGSEPTRAPSNVLVPSWLLSKYDKDIFALAVPAALALAADPLLGMVDTALVGRLGSDELVSFSTGEAHISCLCLPSQCYRVSRGSCSFNEAIAVVPGQLPC